MLTKQEKVKKRTWDIQSALLQIDIQINKKIDRQKDRQIHFAYCFYTSHQFNYFQILLVLEGSSWDKAEKMKTDRMKLNKIE